MRSKHTPPIHPINDNLIHLRDGEVVLYRRENSGRWQARYKLADSKWHRLSFIDNNTNFSNSYFKKGNVMKIKLFSIIVCGLALFGQASASPETRERFARESQKYSDISTFSAKHSSLGWGNPKFNTVIAKDNLDESKKYPVVLIFPACGGAYDRNGGPQQMKLWAEAAIQKGYLAFLVDSLTPRGANQNCSPRPVEDGRLLKDGIDSADFLANLPFIDSDRIYSLGFSLGANTSMLLASPISVREVKKSNLKIRAAASLYGGCQYHGGRHLYVQDDPDQRPLLLLMGAKDTESPPEDCYSFIDWYQKKGRPIESHTYPNISHAWDVPELNGFTKMANNRRQVTYHYSRDVTTDSINRVFQFFEKNK